MRKYLPAILPVIFFVLMAIHAPGQTMIADSLKKIIRQATDGRRQMAAIFELSEQSINADTLLPFVIKAQAIAAATGNKIDMAKAAFAKAGYFARKNNADSALPILEILLTTYKADAVQQPFYLRALFLKAKILDRSNQYSLALAQLYQVVEKATALKDTLVLIQANTGIGWVQMEMEQYKEALVWLNKALHVSPDKKYYNNYGALYSNLAYTHNALGNSKDAILNINIAIEDAKRNSNLLFLATAYSMQAKIFTDNKQPQLAKTPLQKVLEIRKILNDPYYTVYDMSSLSSYYAVNGQSAKGIAVCKEGIKIAKQNGLASQLLMIYRALAQNYQAAGNQLQYASTLESIIALKDSFNNINASKLLAEMQAANESQKKEKTITEQKLHLKVKNYWLISSGIFAVMAAIIIWLGFMYYNRRQHIKMQLALEAEKLMAVQSVINAEEQERKRIAADLHDNIGAYASAIKADVEKIAGNGLDNDSDALHNLQQHSQEIMNSLRDTIWVLNKENITITGISDRIKSYLSKLKPSYTQIQFHYQEEIEDDVRLPSKNVLAVFRIVQEAIHNALKHSNAVNITISINSSKGITISIADDGSGMNQRTANTEGNGFINMKARAAEAGMELRVISNAGKGTLVLLTDTIN